MNAGRVPRRAAGLSIAIALAAGACSLERPVGDRRCPVLGFAFPQPATPSGPASSARV